MLGPRGVSQEHDRADELEFEHQVWRFEKELETRGGDLYELLMKAMESADHEMWRSLPNKGKTKDAKHLHPEVEYIVYDADECRRNGSSPPGIGPHVDNGSCVTLIAMLSDPSKDFEGGVNLFETGSGNSIDNGSFVTLRPQQGDVLMFRGELCEHALTPVTRGTRRILQIELCRKKKGCH